MTTDDVFDLLDHAIEPEPWLCDEQWEYRAMHWRYREDAVGAQPADGAAT